MSQPASNPATTHTARFYFLSSEVFSTEATTDNLPTYLPTVSKGIDPKTQAMNVNGEEHPGTQLRNKFQKKKLHKADHDGTRTHSLW